MLVGGDDGHHNETLPSYDDEVQPPPHDSELPNYSVARSSSITSIDDETVITVPLLVSDLNKDILKLIRPSRRPSLMGSKFNRRGSAEGSSSTQKDFVTVEMTKAEYNKFWKRDANGDYVGTEPQGSGKDKLLSKLISEKIRVAYARAYQAEGEGRQVAVSGCWK